MCSQLLVEGYDDPMVSCVIMARPTKSLTYFIQATVRGDRLDPRVDNLKAAIAEGRMQPDYKRDMLLLDVVDASAKHSLVSLPTLFGLSSKLDLQGMSVMEAVKAIAAIQANNPNMDMSRLEDITKLKSYVEEASLFRVDFCSEITEASPLQWHKRGENTYCLLLPGREQIIIAGNLLGEFAVKGSVLKQNISKDGFNGLPDALAYAEKKLSMHGRSMLTLLRRESKWHAGPVTEGQKKMLKQFKVPESHIIQMTKGDAAKLITRRLGERR